MQNFLSHVMQKWRSWGMHFVKINHTVKRVKVGVILVNRDQIVRNKAHTHSKYQCISHCCSRYESMYEENKNTLGYHMHCYI